MRKCSTIIAGRIPLSAVILTLLRSTHLLVYPYQVKDNLGTHMLQASTQPLILALGSGASATVYGLCLAGVEIMAQSELGSRSWGQSGLEINAEGILVHEVRFLHSSTQYTQSLSEFRAIIIMI